MNDNQTIAFFAISCQSAIPPLLLKNKIDNRHQHTDDKGAPKACGQRQESIQTHLAYMKQRLNGNQGVTRVLFLRFVVEQG